MWRYYQMTLNCMHMEWECHFWFEAYLSKLCTLLFNIKIGTTYIWCILFTCFIKILQTVCLSLFSSFTESLPICRCSYNNVWFIIGLKANTINHLYNQWQNSDFIYILHKQREWVENLLVQHVSLFLLQTCVRVRWWGC